MHVIVTTTEDKHGQSELYSLWDPQPMQVTQQMSDMVNLIILPRVTDKARRCIENGLEPVQQVSGNTIVLLP